MKKTGQKLLAILLILSFVVGQTQIVRAEDTKEVSSGAAESYEISQETLQVEIETEAPENVQSGDKITLYAKASGGAGEYQYQFAAADGRIFQDYGMSGEFTFEAEEGQNQIVVKVKDQLENQAEEKYEVFVEKEQKQEDEAEEGTDKEGGLSEEKKTKEEGTQVAGETNKIIENNTTVEPTSKEMLRVKLESSGTAQEYVSRKITLTAHAEGGDGNYQYKFTENYNGKDKICQDYGENNTYEFTTSGTGKHTYYVDVTDGTDQKARAVYTIYVVLHPSATLKGSLTNNKTSNEYIWRDITLTGEVTGGYGDLQYQFTEVYNGQSKVVQEYSEENSYSFRTGGVGRHVFYLDVKDQEGQTLRLSYTLNVVQNLAAVLKGKIVNNKTANEYIWRDITLTGEVTGGYGDLQYQYTEVYGGKSTVVREYSEEPSYTFRTRKAGLHTYYLDVKDKGGQTLRLIYTLNVVENPAAVLRGTITSDKTAKEYIWRDIVLTGEISGGYGSLQYQYTEVYNGISKIVQEYGDDPSYRFRTEGPGIHIYHLDVKDENGQTKRFSYTLNVVVHPTAVITGKIINNKTANEYIWRNIILTGEITGGYGTLQYQYTEVYNGASNVVQAYSENPVYEFRTEGPGAHIYYLDVKDEGGQIVRFTYTLQVVVHPSYKLTGSFKSNVTGIAKENQAIQLTATSSGGYGEKREYRFRESFNGRTTVLQDYSEKTTCNFNIKGGGLHGYYVDIRDEGKQILTLHLTISLGKNGWYYEGGYKFYYKNNVKQLDLDGILPRQSSYYIKVNRTACTVTVYAKDGNNGYIIPVKRFACSVGLPSTPTPTGTFYTSNKYRWHTLMGPSYGQYCTRIVGGILFHSVAGRNMTSYNLNARDYNKLGSPASHGCVRLCVRDAKWIYDNCPSGTKVTIYDSSNPGPLGKPATIKIPAGQTWDPTDPNI